MKTSTFIFFFLMSGLFISCSIVIDDCKDEDLIMGTWYVTKRVIENCDENYQNGSYTYNHGCLKDAYDNEECLKVTFTSKGSWKFISEYTDSFGNVDNHSSTGTYSVKDGKIKICPESDDCDVFNLEVTKHELILDRKDPIYGCDVLLKFEK